MDEETEDLNVRNSLLKVVQLSNDGAANFI